MCSLNFYWQHSYPHLTAAPDSNLTPIYDLFQQLGRREGLARAKYYLKLLES